ncbi:MAG: hypothetical protein RIC16_08700 [Rhodospirillales bacterium]
MRPRSLLAGLLLVLIVAVPPGAAGAQTDDVQAAFDEIMGEAYAAFRSAHWNARTGDAGSAAADMATFADLWQTLRATYGDAPPPVYAGDQAWQETLRRIADINAESRTLAEAGNATDAFQSIARLRAVFSRLRARNGVFGYSDHVNACIDAIDLLSPYRNWDQPLSETDWRVMSEHAARIRERFRVLADAAPQSLAPRIDFRRALDDNHGALDQLQAALSDRHERAAKQAIRDLRSAIGLFFLRFG